jgi:imidazolonepropionase-like amidohydrolase
MQFKRSSFKELTIMTQQDSQLALVGGKLIDGNGGTPLDDSLVLIDGTTITYAGPRKTVADGCSVIDISGKTVMPGLVDSHLHFTGNESDDDTQWVLDDVTQKTVIAVQQAHDALEAGLTTVGEISRSGIAIRNTINQGLMKGPRMVSTGLGFCRTGGHGDSHKLPLEYNNASHPWAERVDGPWPLRTAVRRRLREDVDAIKIWSTGGGIWRHDDKLLQHYTYEEIKAVVDEASMVHVPVWSHAEGYEGALASAKAGVHLIIHGQALTDECLDIMAEKGIYFCPTIQFLGEWFKTYPPEYNPAQDKYPGETRIERELNRVYDNLRKANDKGITLVTGSDSFCSSLTPYGITLIGEVYSFVEKAGFSPLFALQCATLNGAKMLGVDKVTGTLEEGKSADLLVIDGDPSTNIRDLNCENMSVVMKEGDIIVRR